MEQFTPKRNNRLIRMLWLTVMCLLTGSLTLAQPPGTTSGWGT
jgi:hypothetical protein